MLTLNQDEQFFFDNAGYSYDPKTQTPEQGHIETAQQLAKAELLARIQGYSYSWEIDKDIDSSEFQKGKPYSLWCVAMYDNNGRVVGAMGGVDFGKKGSPYSNNYRRVVEAELAYEQIND